MSKLHISANLSLPVESVTQTFAILGIRGSGKTNTAVDMMEEMLEHGQQCITIDPTDAWYGIRSSKDGKSEGFKVFIMGGEHGDLPLEGNNGAIMAEFVVESGASVVFSLRHLSIHSQRQFAQDFAERLYDLKGKSENRTPLHIFVDEADEFVPQRIPHGFERMYGAYDRLVRRGRSSGIGLTLISQRAQVIAKDVLSQCETLICHRLLHKLDRKAIEAWTEAHDTQGQTETLMGSLASLGRGEAWFWSPSWLDVFKKVQLRPRETFDSSFTPKAGEKPKTATKLAAVDLDVLKQRLAATIEKAKADDPKELKKRIKELEAQAKKSSPNPSLVQRDSTSDPKAIARAVRKAEVPLHKRIRELHRCAELLRGYVAKAKGVLSDSESIEIPSELPSAVMMSVPPIPRLIQATQTRREPVATVNLNGDLTGPERKILRVLGELLSIGKEQAPKNMVAAWSGYSPLGGAFGNPIGALRSKGLIDYPQSGIVVLTDAGRSVVGPCDAPDRDEIWRRIESTCTGPEQKILRALIDNAGQDEIAKEQLAEKAGYSPVGGAFGNPIGALRTKGLLDYPRQGVVKAADWLFAA
jgi:uncharacterized protein